MRRADEFFCMDPLAGRADEDELFPAHSESCERTEVLHGIAAREAHDCARTVGHTVRVFDCGVHVSEHGSRGDVPMRGLG
jgi:hypothetical protein